MIHNGTNSGITRDLSPAISNFIRKIIALIYVILDLFRRKADSFHANQGKLLNIHLHLINLTGFMYNFAYTFV